MANKTITNLTAGGAISAADLFETVQSGNSRKSTAAEIATFVQRKTVTAVSSSSGTLTLDHALGDYFTVTLTENVTTLAFSNLPGSGLGTTIMLRITQDSTPRTFAWPASFRWAGGVPPAISTGNGAIDVLAITTFNNGTNWTATLAKAFA